MAGGVATAISAAGGGNYDNPCPPFYKHLSVPFPDISDHTSMQFLRPFAGLSVFYDIFYHTSG